MSLSEEARKTGFYIPPQTEQQISSTTRIAAVLVHPRVYAIYSFLYTEARRLVIKMEAVRDDAHHQEMLIRGPALGYKMPDVSSIRARTQTLKDTLHSFDPDDACMLKNAVMLPAATAKGLYMTALNAALLIDEIFKNARESEYMLWIRALKITGEEYHGPVSLQQAVDTYTALVNASYRNLVNTPASRERLPEDWVERLSCKPPQGP